MIYDLYMIYDAKRGDYTPKNNDFSGSPSYIISIFRRRCIVKVVSFQRGIPVPRVDRCRGGPVWRWDESQLSSNNLNILCIYICTCICIYILYVYIYIYCVSLCFDLFKYHVFLDMRSLENTWRSLYHILWDLYFIIYFMDDTYWPTDLDDDFCHENLCQQPPRYWPSCCTGPTDNESIWFWYRSDVDSDPTGGGRVKM